MDEAVKKEYKFQRDNLILAPYDAKVANLPEEALITLYNRLKSENLWDIVFHEDTNVTLLKFMNYFSNGQALLQLLVVTDNKGEYIPAGLAWVSDIVVCSGIMMKGVGSFVFFKDFQKPMYTDQFSEMILDYWFNQLGLDLVVGVTPEPNRAAMLYVKRSGFKEVGLVPRYTTFKGAVVDGIVTAMTKDEYKNLLGG